MSVESTPRIVHEAPLTTGEVQVISDMEQEELFVQRNDSISKVLESIDNDVPASLIVAEEKAAGLKEMQEIVSEMDGIKPELVEELNTKAEKGVNNWFLNMTERTEFARVAGTRKFKELSPAMRSLARHIAPEDATDSEALSVLISHANARLSLDDEITAVPPTTHVPGSRGETKAVEPKVDAKANAPSSENEQILPDDIEDRMVMELDGELVEVRKNKNGKDWFYAMNEAGKLRRIGQARVDELAGIQESPEGAQPTASASDFEKAVEGAQETRAALEEAFPSLRPVSKEASAPEESDNAKGTTPKEAVSETETKRGRVRGKLAAALEHARFGLYYAAANGSMSVRELQEKMAENAERDKKRTKIGGAVLALVGVAGIAYLATRGHDTSGLDHSTAADSASGVGVGGGHEAATDTIPAITAPDAPAATAVVPESPVVTAEDIDLSGLGSNGGSETIAAAQEHIGVLSAGQNPWTETTDYLKSLGINDPTNAQIATVNNAGLNLSGISVDDARHLPVGFEFRLPSPDEVENLLDVKLS